MKVFDAMKGYAKGVHEGKRNFTNWNAGSSRVMNVMELFRRVVMKGLNEWLKMNGSEW